MKTQKVFILGLGTGRCGTVSLTTLLSEQDDTNISHELEPHLDWTFNENQIRSRFDIIIKRSHFFVGDISFYNLNYVDYISDRCKELNISLKILHIYRSKEQVVSSYMNKTAGRNHWSIHNNTTWKTDDVWDKCYPKYNTASKKEAISKYCEEYRKKCELYQKKYNIFSFRTDALNTATGVNEILDACWIKSKRVIINIRKNETKAI